MPGTLAYISPERLAGGDATPESDVWSVGVLLWETLTDRHPFWGVPIQEVANSIQAGAPPLATERRGLPRRLVAAVDAALAIDPAARPNASDLAAELRNALRSPQSRPARKERATKHEETLAPAQRHARRAVPVALGVVTAVLGATFLPFWPPELVAAIVVATAIACWLDPRAGWQLRSRGSRPPDRERRRERCDRVRRTRGGLAGAELARRPARAPLRHRTGTRCVRPAAARTARQCNEPTDGSGELRTPPWPCWQQPCSQASRDTSFP